MMNKKTIWTISAAALVVVAFATPSFADSAPAATTCSDGTTSTAKGKGACSKHGGVKKGDAAAPAAAPAKAAAPAATAAPATAPAGATAKCKDGTYSKAKTHSGACSKHGGVDSFLDK
jgi:hypothetical protein